MRVLTVMVLTLAPRLASAGLTLEASLGQGMQLSPKPLGAAQATSIGIAVGWTLLDPLEVQLALLPHVDALRAGELDLEVRTMLKYTPPAIPAYGRLIASVTQLVAGPRRLALGGSIGWQIKVGGVGLFVEVGLLPRAGFGKGGAPKMQWVAEGRAGTAFRF